ncbi:MAG: PIG-L deacetylase family protein, partial [Halobacteriota archaeon]|nr:PIG-L deacetylase family protein [Halobacteriota archaeon]
MTGKNVLAVGAHADDIEIGCGGTVALHAKNGDNVYALIMTKPHYTRYDGVVLRDEDEGEAEEKNGARVLGAEHINLGFETKRVPYSAESVEAINEIIDKYNIDLIYTHWYHDSHQDHARTTRSVISAGRYVKNILMYEPEYPAGRSYTGFHNQYYVDITSTFEIKMEALRQHTSQVRKYGKAFLDAVEARA